ncbi:Uncharacterised protein [Mycobacterium tuberculosis]|uniref:Uncharacterized protein n=2 Tax=Mycobacterium tuberculosis TaxID=1773 RepID=A0A654TZ77_MYCTX|nr:Uncharacterised protein [Mycobacterium tuberculosis]CFR75671.1 Uncharacterised protein [Mycobacterium tuberculosis]CKQ30404.1 Uncharacterised protein [Mycobacterium tuberculosis]CKR79347.1 Uncharacterised protein [Mycobacterium tuberculosis]CKW71142.1 Uncharacterised protein [Mycobacterium tuberculosis]
MLASASARSSASASASLAAGGRLSKPGAAPVSVSVSRMPAGTALTARSSSESTPITASMVATAWLSRPMCRSANVEWSDTVNS